MSKKTILTKSNTLHYKGTLFFKLYIREKNLLVNARDLLLKQLFYLCAVSTKKRIFMNRLSQETIDFILSHRNDDVRQLALKINKKQDIDSEEAIVQIAGWQIAKKKIPSWAANDEIIYPKHLSMEQCSSEVTARYKSTLLKGDTMVDLTAGLGVDCYFISRNFNKAHYVERMDYLCNIAKHNFKTLGADNIEIHNDDCTEYLKSMQPVDCIFLDPARRNEHGGKTVAITDCEPDITKIENTLVEKGKTVMVKLSPMLDIHSALSELKFTDSLHIISVNNECKELVIVLKKESLHENNSHDETMINCEQITSNATSQHFSFTFEEEKNAKAIFAEKPGKYLYEPGAAILKAGPFKLLSSRYGVGKLHINSHLYTSDEMIDFPGRRFEVIETSSFSKKDLKTFLKDITNANITIRNFPSTVDDLRKKLKIKEGGQIYIFATTLNNGEKVLIKCKSIR